MIWKIEITPKAKEMLAEIPDRRIREKISERIGGLDCDPEKQGKPLVGEFSGCRSIRAAGQRYRIIYQIAKEKGIILVVAAGIRKEGDRNDIYTLAKRLVRLGLVPRRN